MAIVSNVTSYGDDLYVVFSDGSRLRATTLVYGTLWMVPDNPNGLTTIRAVGDRLHLDFDGLNVFAFRTPSRDLWLVGPNDEPAPPYVFVWPYSPALITDEWGYRPPPLPGLSDFHSGCDWPRGGGTPIYCAGNGTVIQVRSEGTAGSPGGTSWGNRVVVYHGAPLGVDLYTGYAHMQNGGFPAVSVGQDVSAGQVIGFIGQTGSATGNHLHFATFIGGLAIGDNSDPLNCRNPRDFMATYNPAGAIA